MRVLMDLRPSANPTGIGRYARMLGAVASGVPRHLAWSLGDDLTAGDLDVQAASALEEELTLPALLERESIDVFHSPMFHVPYATTCMSVVTVHDAIPLARPDLTSPAFARLFAEAYQVIHGADRVVCPSHHARSDLVRMLGLPESCIVVIPEFAAGHFQPSTNEERAAARARFGLDGSFFLVVGSIEHRKNPTIVLDALALVPDAQAVFAGPDAGYDLAGEARRRGVEGRVRALGHVADGDLVRLYSAAEALLFPSLYEGFGLPIVEAFACGTPVLCSNAASLPEVAGDAAILFDPKDAKSLVSAIGQLRGAPGRPAELIARGNERSKIYSKDAVCSGLAALYDGLAAELDGEAASKLVASGGRS